MVPAMSRSFAAALIVFSTLFLFSNAAPVIAAVAAAAAAPVNGTSLAAAYTIPLNNGKPITMSYLNRGSSY